MSKKQIRATPSEQKKQRVIELLANCQEEILNSIIGPFGLGKLLFDDKDGGNVTTIPNFEKGITSSESDSKKYKEWKTQLGLKIDRKDYDSNFRKIRREEFKKNKKLKDGYTGKNLKKDGSTQLDHIVSVKNIELDSMLNLHNTRLGRVKIANKKENLTFTQKKINLSKQDKDIEKYSNLKKQDTTNGKKFKLKTNLIKEKKQTAEKSLNFEKGMSLINNESKNLIKTSVDQSFRSGVKQAVGLILHELTVITINEVKFLYKNGLQNQNLSITLSESFNKILFNVSAKKNEIVDAFKLGAINGSITNLVTYVINNFITTYKDTVRIVRENFVEFLKAIKHMLFPPKGISSNEALREGGKRISRVIINSLGMIFEEHIRNFIKTTAALAFVADEVASVITGILTGLSSSLAIYTIDMILDSIENPYSLHQLENLINNNELQLELLNSSLEKLQTDNIILNNCDLSQLNENNIKSENFQLQDSLANSKIELDAFSELLEQRLEILKKLKGA